MLAYAIWYVTVVNVDNDYSFLTLGVITGATAVSVIGLHEWMRSQAGPDRSENPIEEYGGAIAVLMGARYLLFGSPGSQFSMRAKRMTG